jgi:hypothetical protein
MLSSNRNYGQGRLNGQKSDHRDVIPQLRTVILNREYNPYTKKWEDVSPDAVPQVNPMTGKWELAARMDATELIDENGGGPGVRLRRRPLAGIAQHDFSHQLGPVSTKY